MSLNEVPTGIAPKFRTLYVYAIDPNERGFLNTLYDEVQGESPVAAEDVRRLFASLNRCIDAMKNMGVIIRYVGLERQGDDQPVEVVVPEDRAGVSEGNQNT